MSFGLQISSKRSRPGEADGIGGALCHLSCTQAWHVEVERDLEMLLDPAGITDLTSMELANRPGGDWKEMGE